MAWGDPPPCPVCSKWHYPQCSEPCGTCKPLADQLARAHAVIDKHLVDLCEYLEAFFSSDDLLSEHPDVPEFQEGHAQALHLLRETWCNANDALADFDRGEQG